MVLSMYGAQEVDARTAPDSVRPVRGAGRAAGLPMPRVYIIDRRSPTPSPPAAIRKTPLSRVKAGLLQMLSRDELAGVMAHELAHIKNRDTLLMTVTATIAGAISMLANSACSSAATATTITAWA